MAHGTCGLETLPPYILQDILYNGRLGPLDLASLEASSYTFRAASGIEPYRFKSIPELAAHRACQTHPLFQNLPSPARSELLARCEGNWKLVFRFLEAVRPSSGRSGRDSAGDNVLIEAGRYHSLLVNGKGDLYACGTGVGTMRRVPTTSDASAPIHIPLPGSFRRIVQISGSHKHVAFITESGQVYTFGDNSFCCCGVGENREIISMPTLVTTLQDVPCQQVSTGHGFTVVLTKAGELYSWGSASHGQLGHGNHAEQFRPRRIEQFDEDSNPVAHISAGNSHTLAVTRSGQLFSWGYGSNYCLGHDDFVSELQPKQVVHGGLDKMFIVSAVAGDEHSAAIDSLGQVYTWGKGYCGALGHENETDQNFPLLVEGLKGIRAVQVAARRRKTFVLADNGALHAFGWVAYHSLGVHGKAVSDKVLYPHELALGGHKVASVSAGQYHTLVLTRKGAIFGFGDNDSYQLGKLGIPRESEEGNLIMEPTEVFTSLLKV